MCREARRQAARHEKPGHPLFLPEVYEASLRHLPGGAKVGASCATNADFWRLKSNRAREKPAVASATAQNPPNESGFERSYRRILLRRVGVSRQRLCPQSRPRVLTYEQPPVFKLCPGAAGFNNFVGRVDDEAKLLS